MSAKDGGSAFPRPLSQFDISTTKSTHFPEQDGMTLRDYFAGQALAGYLATYGESRLDAPYVAKVAYKMADAMLAERDK